MAEFADGKDEDALRTIGEISEALGIKPHVLRYWEQHFTLLSPLKRSGGRRYYRPEDVALIEEIDRLVNEDGYTLKGAEGVLRSSGRPGLDRRRADRRGEERRSPDSLDAGPARMGESRREKGDKPAIDTAEAISRLKAIRKRLADAIEN